MRCCCNNSLRLEYKGNKTKGKFNNFISTNSLSITTVTLINNGKNFI